MDESDKTIDFYLKEIDKLNEHIQSLESQLNIRWDDERVKEIEKNLERYDIGWSDYPHVGVSEIKYLLSLLKKNQEEKMRLEDKLSKALIEKQIFERSSLDGDDKIDELRTKIKELEEREISHLKELNEIIDRSIARDKRIRELVEEIEKHRLDIWGDGIVEHPADKELYKHIERVKV
jgi:chromosome segregation ATPase